ncbi:single-stranded-DNA-specific exonuclease RecJ [Flavobacteriales bacterium]|nr:single-stranded-DNA-specific exonuclease RecJ [Flavobacteriales bacterium]
MRWKIKEDGNKEQIAQLKKELLIPEIIAKLLVERGITTFDAAKNFFRPSLESLHDPFLMEDMQKAVDRVNEALDKGQRILIYGDYDVDGTTSVALMYSFLNRFTDNIEFYQPDRYTEGYGVSLKSIEYAHEKKTDLIIALDCGIKAVDKVEKANEYGIDFIICDHHRPGKVTPNAWAILNPKKETCSYPYDELCGCGIGLKLAQAIAITRDEDEEIWKELLDLVAIAIAADIVPMTGENRILAYHGLKRVNENPRIGIATILELASKKVDLTITDLVFKLAPRINAAGRIASATKALELLLSKDESSSKEWSEIINTYNNQRRELDSAITEEAVKMVSEDADSKKSTVVFQKDWHKGVVGIVASRLIESYYKPTIVLCGNDGMATGSARSVKGFDVHDAIEQCADLLEQFGGHKYAAGLSLKVENVEAFRKRFEEVVSNKITKEQQTREIGIDGTLTTEDIKPSKQGDVFPKLYRLIEQFAPFGPGNMKPTFIMKDLYDKKGWSRIVGETHLKISAKQKGENLPLNGIAFGLGEKLTITENEKPFQAAFSLDKNYYNDRYTLQLMIKDIKGM